MTNTTHKIGLGGGCHWCTEGIFSSLIGIDKMEQGWISSVPPYDRFSEGVIAHFNPDKIDLKTLITIHLETHSSTNKHAFRKKYRSAIYTFDKRQQEEVEKILCSLQSEYMGKIITYILPFQEFKENEGQFLNYYFSKPDAPFCRNYITPKIRKIMKEFSGYIDQNKLEQHKVNLQPDNQHKKG